MPSTFVVFSREHKLLHLAHRLSNIEGVDTEIILWKKSFENAWSGMLDLAHRPSHKEINGATMEALKARANSDEIVLLHDIPALRDEFADAKHVYGIKTTDPGVSPIRLGFWWDGTSVSAKHMLLYDMGAWPGGMGAYVPGGVTLVKVRKGTSAEQLYDEMVTPEAVAWLDEQGFKGLVNVGFIEENGQLVLAGWELGWPSLHTQAFMGNVEQGLGDILLANVTPELLNLYSVATPVSIPPWPPTTGAKGPGKAVGRAETGLPITLNDKLHQYVYWFDVQIDKQERSLSSAGLDGLLGIVHAQANVFENAKQKVLAVCGLVGVQEKQYRPDVGSSVHRVLAGLEEQFGVVI